MKPVQPVTRLGSALSEPWVSPAGKQGASFGSPLPGEPSGGPAFSYGPVQKFHDASGWPCTSTGWKTFSLVHGVKCPIS